MRAISLFAGIGGIDLGLERAGVTVVAHSENDAYASRILAKHWPNVPNLGDITQVDWEPWQGVDIIAGGFPCQDISLAGKGAGIDGERSGLWREYVRAIRVVRPRGVLVENVAALANRGLDRVLGDLASCGYDAEWDCVPAGGFGAPHLRDRMFVIAYGSYVEGRDESDRDGSDPGGGRGSDDGLRAGRNESRGAGATVAGSNTDSGGCSILECDVDGLGGAPQRRPITADTHRQRRNERDGSTVSVAKEPPGARRESESVGWSKPRVSRHWFVEPNVGRVADGVPHRVDRLRCLGNAVVPQVAEHIARILIDRLESLNVD
jgi:DNA (cytosine-5)-methyltransferase 1